MAPHMVNPKGPRPVIQQGFTNDIAWTNTVPVVRGPHVEKRVPNVGQLQRKPESVSEREQLIVLSNPPEPHQVWEGALDSFQTTGSLHFLSSQDINISIPDPIVGGPQRPGTVAINVSIHGRKLNPSIRVEVSVCRTESYGRTRILTAHIDWSFNPIKHLGGLRKCGITKLDAHIDTSRGFMELSFVPECAVSVNLLPVTHDTSLLELVDNAVLSEAELSLLRDLANIVQHPNGRRLQVRFDIAPREIALIKAGNTGTPYGRLLRELPTIDNLAPSPDFAKHRWCYYRREGESPDSESPHDSVNGGHGTKTYGSSCTDSVALTPATGPLQVQFNDMKSRHSILSSPHPGTPLKPVMVFKDQDDALISLAYGSQLEFEEQDATFQAVRRDPHFVRLCSVDNRVLALVDFSSTPKTGLPNDRFRLDDRTKVDLRIGEDCMDTSSDRFIKASGLIVANVFDLPRCDLLILIDDKWAKSFKHYVHPIQEFQQSGGEAVWKAPVYVSPSTSSSSTRLEIEAVVRAYGPGCPSDRLPFLLGDGSLLSPVNPVRDFGAREKIAPLFTRLRNAKPWNEQQLEAIASIEKSPGGAMVVTGPGGTGKTELICHLVRFAVGCGQYAVISGTRNDTLDDMTQKLDRMDTTLRPVRVYAPSQEKLAILCQYTPSSNTAGDKHRLLVDTFDAIEKDTKKARRSLPQFSVLGRVLQNLSRETPLKRAFRSPEYRSVRRPARDVRAYFRERLPLLRMYQHSQRLPWINGDEEREFIYQAYQYLRAEVIGEARVILATNAITGHSEICTNFANNSNVWIFQDEAQSMTEGAALIPLGLHSNTTIKGQAPRKVVMHFLSGDLNQLPPFTCARTGEHNTVNEFAAQRSISLMERKLSSGFPAIALVEQRRAAEILMRGANMFHYGGNLTTPSYPPLEGHLKDFIPSLAGIKVLPHDSQGKRRMAWLEVDGPVYENKYTGSRANLANVAVVRRCLLQIHDIYGTTTQSKVMLATPYKRQKELYLSMGCELKNTFGWSDKELPRIVTIDSLIGRESSLVILDLVNNGTEGFMRDVRRSCVAFTRAKDLFLVIGGRFPLPNQSKQIEPKLLKDPITGRTIAADMSRPLAFYHSFFAANGLMYPQNMCKTEQLPMPSDLQPLGQDIEDKQIEEEFTWSGHLREDDLKDSWRFVGDVPEGVCW